ncbi:hypothetical protein H9X88_21595 [Aeromonas hydrophila]|uniref:phage head spike fiber domain-containing protein n=1 Tax=Aeromonas hydrophila TaxID=644 RepID=UPI001B3A2B99|nr:hypothetical protein [Aeromonas hydrophila]MBQ4675604.1 hypothetical protein [Aeromonas hydrophila]MBW3814637.1 hypothetical protein [Aeromonas hydrophila]MCF7680666.1 hypothetical protein [Aeromonas hydrophila]MCF7693574.1 hypothetical protein [Aeromonas hydrophila]MCF7774445.1 hypothetical protein [Aeromonas hydrophila]
MAATDKDPTEAILLVEQTIGTFNQIVVGQEGQMVPVPGYPDQPTLAERVKQNLKPSTDAAAGFAAQAAASAKAADDAAKLASQISGLETVADAIGMAALPLPDVWAPLSDSLRLITGYGRDVLVGSDVVARMVNFSRNSTATYIGKDGQLKTAAANEPRFEKEGLLIEGNSTNIVPRSTDMSLSPWYTGFGGSGKAPVITSNYGVAPDGSQSASRVVLDKGAGTDPSNDSTVMCTLSTVAGTTYTLSVWMKSTDGAATQKVSLSLNGAMATTVTVTGEWRRYSVTALATDSSRIPRLQLRGGAGTSDTADLLAWGWQQEALPFASSYIPTAGAAVTRAADEWNIPNKINCGPAPAMPMSVAVNFTCMGYVSFNNIFVAGDRQLMVYAGTNKLRVEQGGYSAIDITSNVVGYGGAQNKLRAACSDSRVACLLNGIMTERSGGTPIAGNGFDYFGSSKLRNQFGHIRDLRIWRIALTNEQLKAIA